MDDWWMDGFRMRWWLLLVFIGKSSDDDDDNDDDDSHTHCAKVRKGYELHELWVRKTDYHSGRALKGDWFIHQRLSVSSVIMMMSFKIDPLLSYSYVYLIFNTFVLLYGKNIKIERKNNRRARVTVGTKNLPQESCLPPIYYRFLCSLSNAL